MYLSKAIIILGLSGLGAIIFTFNLASIIALTVVAPHAAIRVLFCLNSGKFSNKERISAGLKKHIIS